jgi:general secretion pathway protein D
MKLINIFLVIFVSFVFAQSNKVVINFQDLQINDFIKMVSKISDKNILQNYNIPGKVNFISVKPIQKEQVYNLLVSILKNKGYALVDSQNGFMQIVRSSDAVREAPPVKKGMSINQIQTYILGLKNISAAKTLSQVKLLLSKYGKVTISKETNTLIITDFLQNLKNIKSVIIKLDRKKRKTIKFYKLRYSKVSSIVPKIKNIANNLYNQNIPDQKIDIIADESTNSVIIISNTKIVQDLSLFLEKLDKKDEVLQRYIHVVMLKNADAKKVEKILSSLIYKIPKLNSKKQKVKSSNIEKPTVTADQETNNIVVYASQEEFKEIKKLIDAMDTPRQQVYVSAKIVEISDTKSKKIGAKYGVLGGVANSSGLYTLSAELGSPAIPFDLSSMGIDMPTISKGLALGASISLLSSRGAADVLSEPSLLCVNNMESTIYVGKTESIITQGSVGSSTTDVTKNTYTRQDIGLTLKVKPRISSDNKVFLNVTVVMEDVLPGSKEGLPITTKRDVKTTAIVKNGESIIIGGLLKDKSDKQITKVPILGDIPILGNIFKHTQKSRDKVSLLVILTPYIVTKSEELSNLRSILAKLNAIEQQYIKNIEKR